MGSAPSRRNKAANIKTPSKDSSANVCVEEPQPTKMPRVVALRACLSIPTSASQPVPTSPNVHTSSKRSLAPMPKPVCADCGAAHHTAQYRRTEQRRLCATCLYGSLPDLSEKKGRGASTSKASVPKEGGTRWDVRFSPLPLMVNTTPQPTSSMGPIAKSRLRGCGVVAMDCGASVMKRRSLSEACLKEASLLENDDCSTQAPSDASSDARSDSGSTTSGFSSEKTSTGSETWNIERSSVKRRSLPCIHGVHGGLQQTARTARKEESRKLCDRRPKSNMLRRRYVHCCA